MMKIFSIIILLLIFPLKGWAGYQFEGLSEEDQKLIESNFKNQLKAKVNLTVTDAIIRSLAKKGIYQNVVAYKEKGNIVIVATPIRNLSSIEFTGNQSLSSKELLEISQLESGERFERKKVIEAGNRLKELYGQKGFFNTKIEVSFKPKSKTQLIAIFKIEEGQACLIEEIQYQSENKQLIKRLVNINKKFMLQSFTQELIEEIESNSRNFFRKSRYLRSKLEQDKVEYNEDKTKAKLFYKVTSPYRYELVINGLKDDETDEATRKEYELRSGLGFNEFEVSSLDPASEVEQKAKTSFFGRGYPHAQLETKSAPSPRDPFTKIITLIVNEGPRVKIESLSVTGRISRPVEFYTDFIIENSSELIQSGYYNREDLNLGQENLVTQLKNEGFLKAKVHSVRVEFNKKKDKAQIEMVMDEGPLTQIRKLRFSDIKDFTDLELTKILGIKTNSSLRLNDLEAGLSRLKTFYANKGYLEMRIRNENEKLISYNEKGTEAYIQIKIYEGPKVIVDSITIEGNIKTKSDVILKEIEMDIGSVLTQEKIIESTRRLNRMGLFSRVTMRTLEEGTSLANRTVIISVAESKPGLFRTGFGVTSEDNLTLRGFIGTSYSNLGGTARALSNRVELKSNVTQSQELQSKVTAGYLEPFLLGSRVRGRTNVTYQLTETDYNETEETAIMRESNGIDFLIEKEFTKRLKLIWTFWSFESQRNFTIPASDIERTSIAHIGPRLEIDYRNNPYSPTSGNFTRWDTQYSHPNLGSSDTVNFVRTDLRFSTYLPVGKSGTVWANNISGGFIKNLSSLEDSGVPSSRSFFLHGQSKVRGFGGSNTDEHIPNGDQFDTTSTSNADLDVVKDESTYYLLKTEFRIPMPFAPDLLDFAIFYDAGAVDFTDEDKQCTHEDSTGACTTENSLRESAGIGVHIKTPIGPFTLEMARKISRREGEDEIRWHLSVGSF